VQGHAAAARHLLRQGADARGARSAAPQGARARLHRKLGEVRGRGGAFDRMIQGDEKDGVARVMLDRPDVRNAFDDSLIKALTETFRALDAKASVRAMVLGGNGPAFCAGADLNWMKRMSTYGHDDN